jgi:hypothetical protein
VFVCCGVGRGNFLGKGFGPRPRAFLGRFIYKKPEKKKKEAKSRFATGADRVLGRYQTRPRARRGRGPCDHIHKRPETDMRKTISPVHTYGN